MEYKTLKGDLKVSAVSFGCMSLKDSSSKNDILINRAIDNGITLFDTADLYDKGENEKLLGKAVKEKRKDIHISTKVGNRWKEDGSGWDWVPRKDYILTAVDESLKRLGTDYIDLYLLHGGTIEDPADEVIEAFEHLVEIGKIRAYGISSIRPNVIRQYTETSNISAVMTQYSLFDRRPEEHTLELLKNNNVGILARGTVASGLLADKPAKDYLGYSRNEVDDMLSIFKNNLPHNKTAAIAAQHYVIDNPAVTTAVIGIRTIQQLATALSAANSEKLTVAELGHLAKLWPANIYNDHR